MADEGAGEAEVGAEAADQGAQGLRGEGEAELEALPVTINTASRGADVAAMAGASDAAMQEPGGEEECEAEELDRHAERLGKQRGARDRY